MSFSCKKIFQSSKSSQTGFTLIEVLIALTVFSIGILAVMTLSDANIRLARENADRVVAANLAREGIELVRNVRDSNWLKIEGNATTDCGTANICPWDFRLPPDNTGYFAIDYDYENSGLRSGCGNWDMCLDGNSAIGRIYLNKATGYYSNDSGSGQATNFSRIMHIQSICLLNNREEIFNGNCSGAGRGEKIGLEVTARVRWQRYGKTNQLDVTEHLYNWRY